MSRTLALALILVGIVGLDGFLLVKRNRYREETARLRADMTGIERARSDAIVAAEADRSTLILELMRRQSQGDEALHLAVNTDSGYVALDRGPVRLRTMPARFGPERRVGVPPDTLMVTVPRGLRVVERRLAVADSTELPVWLWTDRGQTVPVDRRGPGWLGANAIVVSGGAVLYALPDAGPLADSSYVMPGAVRLSAADLAAIRDNVTPGMRVYYF